MFQFLIILVRFFQRKTRSGKRNNPDEESDSKEAKISKTGETVITVSKSGEIFEFEINDIDTAGSLNQPETSATVVKGELEIGADTDEDEATIFMDDETLKDSVAKLLDLVMDEETLQNFGWPDASIESVLSSVIEQCGQTPADYDSCSDYTTKMRENVKLLFTTVIDNESIKSMLNNYTIDEVIKHVLKLAKV